MTDSVCANGGASNGNRRAKQHNHTLRMGVFL